MSDGPQEAGCGRSPGSCSSFRGSDNKQVLCPDLNKRLLVRPPEGEAEDGEGRGLDGAEAGAGAGQAGSGAVIPCKEENEGVVLCKLEEEMPCQVQDKILRNLGSRLLWLGLFASYGEHPDSKNIVKQVMPSLKVFISVFIFCVLAVVVPVLDAFLVQCEDCEESDERPFQRLVDGSESCLSAISFVCLLYLLWKNGLREILLLDDVYIRMDINLESRHRYRRELEGLFPRHFKILFPFFAVELVHCVLWFKDASIGWAPAQSVLAGKIVMCFLVLVGWTYNNGMFLFMCLLFKLMCSLEVLRLHEYYSLVVQEADPERNTSSKVLFLMLKAHIALRKKLLLISHRFRIFLVSALITITVSQFFVLFQITNSGDEFNFRSTGDLAVCCVLQLVGFTICLHSAAKITHMAQRIVSVVSQWHALESCNEDALEQEDIKQTNTKILSSALTNGESSGNSIQHIDPFSVGRARFQFAEERVSPLEQFFTITSSHPPRSSEVDEIRDINASLKLFQSTSTRKHSLGSSASEIHAFHKRHALVTYLQHCSAGISVYGFVLDRGCVYTIFAMELSIVLWALGTII